MKKKLPAPCNVPSTQSQDIVGFALAKAIECIADVSRINAEAKAVEIAERAKSESVIAQIREQNRRTTTRIKMGEFEASTETLDGGTVALAAVLSVAGVGAIAALSICGGRHEKS